MSKMGSNGDNTGQETSQGATEVWGRAGRRTVTCKEMRHMHNFSVAWHIINAKKYGSSDSFIHSMRAPGTFLGRPISVPVTVPGSEKGDPAQKVLTEEGGTARETAAVPSRGSGRCRSKLGPPPQPQAWHVCGTGHTCNPIIAQVRSEAPALLRHWRFPAEGHSPLRRKTKRCMG